MIREAAFLDLRTPDPETCHAFEDAFRQASQLIAATPGYLAHTLERRVEAPGRYLLLVDWERLEDHTVGFRQSSAYQEWKHLLHHF